MPYALLSNSLLTSEQLTYINQALAPSVCRLNVPGVVATGFVVGKVRLGQTGLEHRFLLTNHHVNVQGALQAGQVPIAWFGFTELGKPPAVIVNVYPHVFAENAQLDYVLICLEHSPQLESYLSMRQDLGPLIKKYVKPVNNDPLVLIGHPAGSERKVDPSAYCITHPNPPSTTVDYSRCIFYQSCSYHGASGSPCFSVPEKRLYAIHSGGNISGPATHVGISSAREYGVLLWEVITDIADQYKRRVFQRNAPPALLTLGDIYTLFPHARP